MNRYLQSRLRRLFPRAMHARARSHSLWSEIEEDLLPVLVDPHRGSVDAGANLGRYTVLLSKLCKFVYSFEPDEELAEFLASAARSNVRVSTDVLSAADGTIDFVVPVSAGERVVSMGHVPVEEEFDSESQVRTVRATKLDNLRAADIGFVKIDVEGHEVPLLEGSQKLIERRRPVVLIEVEERHSSGSVSAVCRFFSNLGYVGVFVYRGKVLPVAELTLKMQDTTELTRGVPRRKMEYVNNYIYFPKEFGEEDYRARIESCLRGSKGKRGLMSFARPKLFES